MAIGDEVTADIAHRGGLAGDPDAGAVGDGGGVLKGVVSFGAPAVFVRYRVLVMSGADREAVLAR